MIARLHVILPFEFTIPEGEKFNVFSYIDEGHRVTIFPPKKSDMLFHFDDVEKITINDTNAFRANGLQIDFVKDKFDRRENITCDPPIEFIKKTINFFLIKVRFITKAAGVKPIDFPNVNWRITYLSDDETELSPEEGLVRARLSRSLQFSWIVINNNVWENLHSLPPDYNPPSWELLLLDAKNLLPEIGPSIVLAFTALEVFISIILDLLAYKSPIPQNLWKWINKRKGFLQNPTSDEQFDNLLKILTGISLKDDNELWKALINLRKARNSFVHEGIAKIGNSILDREDAKRLVGSASEIINFIKEKLPEDIKWPEFKYNFEIQAEMKVFKE